MFNRFSIDVLATTDDPLDDLAAHAAIAESGALGGRVVPTFRPDAYMDPTAPGFAEHERRDTRVAELLAVRVPVPAA